MEKKYFDYELDVAKFAATYSLTNVDLTKFRQLDKYTPEPGYSVNKWHLSDVDPDYFIRESISIFYNNFEDVEYAFRSIISIGLDVIYEKIKDNENWNITDLL